MLLCFSHPHLISEISNKRGSVHTPFHPPSSPRPTCRESPAIIEPYRSILGERILSFVGRIFVAMAVRQKSLKKDAVKRKVKAMDKKMPFQVSPRTIQPRSMRDRQQMWCLAGLKHIRAPVVS